MECAPRILATLGVLLTTLSFASCSRSSTVVVPRLGPPNPGLVRDRNSESQWANARWIAKTASLLRAGDGLRPDENVAFLTSGSKQQAIDHFMRDPRFGDMVLDFSMYFLGFKRPLLRNDDGTFRNEVFGLTNAIAAAQAVVNDGDFLKLFSLETDVYLPPLLPLTAENPDEQGKSSSQIRALRFSKITEGIEALESWAATHPQAALEEFCRAAGATLSHTPWEKLGLHAPFVQWMFSSTSWYGAMTTPCAYGAAEPLPYLELVRQIKTRNASLYAALTRLEQKNTPPAYARDIAWFDVSGVKVNWMEYSGLIRELLPNTSTNYNRKRAQYMLKRFFCDDMTPISVVSPGEHAGGDQHGSDPSCFACHYKLDPMAGFFRNYGSQFLDFSKSPTLMFEDRVSMNREKYLSSWRAEAQSGREWNVGYIRSTTRPEKNNYGESLADLFKTIREAPEVRRCLVRRLHQYVVGEEQSVDAGYIQYLADRFSAKAMTNSAEAFRDTLSVILSNQAYQESDPSPTQCYDYRPGHQPKNSPPCTVAFILERDCAKCHSSTDHSSGLDLSRWIQLGSGAWTFPHLDWNQKQVPPAVTMEKIIDRLSSGNDALRMPPRSDMSPTDRELLYLWAQDQKTKAVDAVQETSL